MSAGKPDLLRSPHNTWRYGLWVRETDARQRYQNSSLFAADVFLDRAGYTIEDA